MGEIMNKEVYSRTKKTVDDWETPPYFFKLLEEKLLKAGTHFTLDACASPSNAKCEKYFTKEEDGLEQDWQGETVFVNPPFSHVAEWSQKCFEESQKKNTVVVMIIPPRTDTRYWDEWIMRCHEVLCCKGRVNFLKNGERTKNGSTFPLLIIIFKKTNRPNPILKMFYHKESDWRAVFKKKRR